MADRWLLVETFGGGERREPTVIALGQTPKRMVPLESVLGRGGYIRPVRAMIDQVAATGEAFRGMTRDGRRQLIADPLTQLRGPRQRRVRVGRPGGRGAAAAAGGGRMVLQPDHRADRRL